MNTIPVWAHSFTPETRKSQTSRYITFIYQSVVISSCIICLMLNSFFTLSPYVTMNTLSHL
jgi:hypothetical protein